MAAKRMAKLNIFVQRDHNFSPRFHIAIAIQKSLRSHSLLQRPPLQRPLLQWPPLQRPPEEIDTMPMQEGYKFANPKAFRAAMQELAMAGAHKFNFRYGKSRNVCAHNNYHMRISTIYFPTRQCIVEVSMGEEHNCVGAGQISRGPTAQQTWLQHILPTAFPSASPRLLGKLLMPLKGFCLAMIYSSSLSYIDAMWAANPEAHTQLSI